MEEKQKKELKRRQVRCVSPTKEWVDVSISWSGDVCGQDMTKVKSNGGAGRSEERAGGRTGHSLTLETPFLKQT